MTDCFSGKPPQGVQEEAKTDQRRRRQKFRISDSLGKPGDRTRMSPGGHRLPVVPGKYPQDVQEEAETGQRRRGEKVDQSEASTPRHAVRRHKTIMRNEK